jgi:hypothetical protein
MVSDEHHPSPPKLLDHAEAVIEHHRQADDDDRRVIHDRTYHAKLALIEYVREYRDVIDNIDVHLGHRHLYGQPKFDNELVEWPGRIRLDLPAVDPPGDR